MVTKTNQGFLLSGLIIGSLLICFCNGCGLFLCDDKEYDFQVQIEFFPDDKILHLGDTLWITSSFSCSNMVDLVSGNTVSFCDIPEVKNSLGIEKYPQDTLPLVIAAPYLFDYLIETGDIFTDSSKISINASRKIITFEQTSGHYQLLIGMIPKETGRYGIYVGDPPHVILENKKHCVDRGNFNFDIANEDRHLELLYEPANSYPPNDPINRNYYCFEVVE